MYNCEVNTSAIYQIIQDSAVDIVISITLNALMDSSFWIDEINLKWSIV